MRQIDTYLGQEHDRQLYNKQTATCMPVLEPVFALGNSPCLFLSSTLSRQCRKTRKVECLSWHDQETLTLWYIVVKTVYAFIHAPPSEIFKVNIKLLIILCLFLLVVVCELWKYIHCFRGSIQCQVNHSFLVSLVRHTLLISTCNHCWTPKPGSDL